MKKSEWSDKELIDLLKQMPRVEDYRHPRDIYQNLAHKRRKKIPWLFPGIAAAAALFLFIILVPKLMDGTQYSMDNARQESTKEMKVAKEDSNVSSSVDKETQQNQASTLKKAEVYNEDIVKTAVYADEVKDGMVLTYWVPDDQAQNLVPVSMIVTKTDGKDWLTLFNENMANLKETEWGLSEYYPLQATLSYDKSGENIIVDVPVDHPYKHGSANEVKFLSSLSNDLASNSTEKKIKFTTNGEPGIELGNNFLDELLIDNAKNHAYFLYYPNGSEGPFLVPSPETYKDIDSALRAMRTMIKTHHLQSSLLPELEIKNVSSTGQTLTITFAGLEDDQLTTWSLEAILLTAKEFGFEKVIVINPPLSKIGPFDLSKEIKVPIAPNLREIIK